MLSANQGVVLRFDENDGEECQRQVLLNWACMIRARTIKAALSGSNPKAPGFAGGYLLIFLLERFHFLFCGIAAHPSSAK